MRAEDVRQHLTTPLTSPAYAPTVPRFTDREYLNVVYRTDPDALRAVVPEPLRIGEPVVRFEVMKMGDVSGYGPYTEAGQAIPVGFEGEHGEYLHAMYLDNFPATASGREVSAYPKVLGSPALTVDSGALVGTLDHGSLRVATATMGYKHHELDRQEARAQITVPAFMLKTVPGYDGSPRVQELVRTRITDVTVKEAWTGPARLQLFQHVLGGVRKVPSSARRAGSAASGACSRRAGRTPVYWLYAGVRPVRRECVPGVAGQAGLYGHPLAPLADLPVLEVVSASHILTDLTLSGAEPVHDYLKGAAS